MNFKAHVHDWDARGHGWIQTYTGRQVFPLDLKIEDVDIRDLAHSLSCQGRFTGHTRMLYNTAEHSVHVSRLIAWLGGNPAEQLYGLIHDGGEAYLADISRPVKHHPDMHYYREREKLAASVVAQSFGLPAVEPEIVKRADSILLGIEARDLMSPLVGDGWQHFLDMIPADYPLRITQPWDWQQAEKMFLARYRFYGFAVAGDTGKAVPFFGNERKAA